MNLNDFKLIAIDYVLPCVVVVGTGLISYMLTGGEYEYPSIETNHIDPTNNEGSIIRDDEIQQNFQNNINIIDLINQMDIKSDQQLIRVSQVSEQLHTLSNTSASSTLAMIDALEQSNMVLKEIQKHLKNQKLIHNTDIYNNLCTSCKELVLKDMNEQSSLHDLDDDDDPSTSRKVVEIIRISNTIDWLINLRYSIFIFLISSLLSSSVLELEDSETVRANVSKFSVSTSTLSIEDKLISLHELIQSYYNRKEIIITNDQGLLTKGCEMLQMYISNIIKNPNVPRYRRISTNNQSYISNLFPLKGHQSVLLAVGFVQKGSHYEWEWHTATVTATLATVAVETTIHNNKENTLLQNNHSILEAAQRNILPSSISSKTDSSSSSTIEIQNDNTIPSSNSHSKTTNSNSTTNTTVVAATTAVNTTTTTVLRCEDTIPRDSSAVDSVLKEAIELLTALKISPITCLELLNNKIEVNQKEVNNIAIITEKDEKIIQKDDKSTILNYNEIFGQLTQENAKGIKQ